MIAVIQFRTDESLEHEQRCFNKYLPKEFIEFHSIFDDKLDLSKPKVFLKKYRKLIISGTGEFLLSRNDKIDKEIQTKIKPLIDYVVENDFSTLGVCFGCQLLGKLQGGHVERDTKQAEAGIQSVRFTENGRSDPIFNDIHNPISVAMGHEDSVIALPDNAIRLAYSNKCNNQAYKIGDNVYGVQFHPEFDDNDLYERLRLYSQYDEFSLGHDIPEIVHGPQILQNFVNLPIPDSSEI